MVRNRSGKSPGSRLVAALSRRSIGQASAVDPILAAKAAIYPPAERQHHLAPLFGKLVAITCPMPLLAPVANTPGPIRRDKGCSDIAITVLELKISVPAGVRRQRSALRH